MKVVEHHAQTGWQGTVISVITAIFPFIGSDDDETKPVPDDGSGLSDEERAPGYIVIDEGNGLIELNFSSEWMYDGWWSGEQAEEFGQAMLKAAEIARKYAPRIETPLDN